MQEYLPERTDGSGAAKAGAAGDFSGWLGSDLLLRYFIIIASKSWSNWLLVSFLLVLKRIK